MPAKRSATASAKDSTMWNQDWFTEADYDADEIERFPAGAGFPGKSSADWGWTQHILASLKDKGRAAVVWDTGAASRGSGKAGTNKEKTVRLNAIAIRQMRTLTARTVKQLEGGVE